MNVLSSAMLTQLGLTVTRPGYLIYLGYSSPIRLSTLGTISWNSQTWTAAHAVVSDITHAGNATAEASLELGNTDDAFGAIVLNEGASDVSVQIWACYAGATATGDPLMVMDGVLDGAEVTTRTVKLDVTAQYASTLYSPRRFINKASGFNHLRPAGTKIVFGNETYVLERG